MIKIESQSKLGCLISGSIETKKSGFFSYPIELYGYKQLNISDVDADSLFFCSIRLLDGNGLEDLHCYNKFPNEFIKCPVHDDLIDLFTKSSKPIGNEDAICNWSRHLETRQSENSDSNLDSESDPPSPVNIIVFGGSVTEGKWTHGCCCGSWQCPEFSEHCSKMHEEINNTTGLTDSNDIERHSHEYIRYCAWPRYIFDHITTKFPNATIHTFNLGIDAFSSERMYGRLDEKLATVGIQRFSSSDLIILDHSMNDAV